MTPAEHTSQLDRVRGSLLETHCDVYAPRDRTVGKPDTAIMAHRPGPSPARSGATMAVRGLGASVPASPR
jgi:hypothetical protein